MTNDLAPQRFPWEPVPVQDTVALLQKDVAYMVQYTAVLVHSNNPALSMLVNTPRGQIIPRNECKFAEGTTIEFQDIGMPQVNAPIMTVSELIAKVWDAVRELGLEIQT
jgi:hypothetical protein